LDPKGVGKGAGMNAKGKKGGVGETKGKGKSGKGLPPGKPAEPLNDGESYLHFPHAAPSNTFLSFLNTSILYAC